MRKKRIRYVRVEEEVEEVEPIHKTDTLMFQFGSAFVDEMRPLVHEARQAGLKVEAHQIGGVPKLTILEKGQKFGMDSFGRSYNVSCNTKNWLRMNFDCLKSGKKMTRWIVVGKCPGWPYSSCGAEH